MRAVGAARTTKAVRVARAVRTARAARIIIPGSNISLDFLEPLGLVKL